MKIMITGAAGQLGTELTRQLSAGGSALGPLPERLALASVLPVDIDDVNIADRHETVGLIRRTAPDVVINCAAFTQVDRCETEPDAAFAVNALGARNVALGCSEVNAKLIHISTDYVFSGEGDTPFSETSPTAPASVYGKTKLLGEEYVRAFCSSWFIVRTAWLYGRTGGNFVKTMLKLGAEQPEISVVNDQLGNPTNAEDLAHHLLKLAVTKEYGLYHCTGLGTCSWYDFTREILRLAGLPAAVRPVTTAEYPRPAKRPAFSALDHTMLRATIGDDMRPWQAALEDFLIKYRAELLPE